MNSSNHYAVSIDRNRLSAASIRTLDVLAFSFLISSSSSSSSSALERLAALSLSLSLIFLTRLVPLKWPRLETGYI